MSPQGLIFVLCVVTLATAQPKTRITISTNGYDNVVAAIHPGIAEDPKIIDELKKMFATGSEYLHIATRERSYFRNVTILVPSTWQDKPEYESATWESFEDSDLRVDQKNPVWGHNPYTKQTGGCGDPGHYIHLTPEFVTDTMIVEKFNRTYIWGDVGRVLVHEFAHLRWGVFDEYGFADDPDHPLFYLDARGSPRVTGCIMYPRFRGRTQHKTTRARCARDPNTRQLEPDCRFYPELGPSNRARASVMYMQFVNSVDTFCENNHPDTYRRHNSLAPNKQNKMCSQQGTWDVISKHADFTNTNFPKPNVDTTPNIKVVYPRKSNPKDVVLVLDTSGSMVKNNRFVKLNQAVAQFIHDSIPIGSNVGMVHFSSRPKTITPRLLPIRSDEDKDALMEALPTEENLGGGTGIGNALLATLKLLDYKNKDISGTTVILVTDGKENRSPRVADIMDAVVKSGVTVNAVAYTDDAEDGPLEELANNTGGLFFFCAEDDQTVRLGNAFDQSVKKLSDDGQARQDLASYVTLLKAGSYHRRSVPVDETVGRDTEFTFTYTNGTEIEVVVTSPDKERYGKGHAYYNDNTTFSIIRISIPMANPGKWSYSIKLLSPDVAPVQISVKSRSRSVKSAGPIKVNAWMSSIAISFPAKTVVLAEVSQGYSPVIGATVLANVHRPTGGVHTMKLFDNGAGADVQANDGVYSGYFTAFTSNGKYAVQAVVSNDGRAQLKKGGGSGGGATTQDPDINVVGVVQVVPAPQFERVGTAGGFSVVNYVDGTDPFPPSRVVDMKVVTYSDQERTVTLAWTAPGDDLDQGTVSAYEVKMSVNDTQLSNNYMYDESAKVHADDIVGSLTLVTSGEKQEMTIRVPQTGEEVMFFFRIRPIDKADQHGDPSNMVGANMAPKPDDGDWKTGVIIASVVAVIAIVIAGVALFVCKKKVVRPNSVEARKRSMMDLPDVA